MKYFIIIGLSVSIIFLSLFFRKRNLSKKLQELRERWGKIPEDQLDLESVKIYFQFTKNIDYENSYCIDDATWADLDLMGYFRILCGD